MIFSIGYKCIGKHGYITISGCCRKQNDPESLTADFRGHFVANVAEAELQCTLFTHYLNSN